MPSSAVSPAPSPLAPVACAPPAVDTAPSAQVFAEQERLEAIRESDPGHGRGPAGGDRGHDAADRSALCRTDERTIPPPGGCRAQPGRPCRAILRTGVRPGRRHGDAHVQRNPDRPDHLGQGHDAHRPGGRELLPRRGRVDGGEMGGVGSRQPRRRRGGKRGQRRPGNWCERARLRADGTARHQPAGRPLRQRVFFRAPAAPERRPRPRRSPPTRPRSAPRPRR